MRSLVSNIETRWITKTDKKISVKETLKKLKSENLLTKKTTPIQGLVPLAQLYVSINKKLLNKGYKSVNKGQTVLLTKKDRSGLSYKYKATLLRTRWKGIHTSVLTERRGFSYSDNVNEQLSLLSPSLLSIEKLVPTQQ